MSLDERKLIILKSIIDDYILTAAPIGSRTISKKIELGLSSATIRNEMSDLEEMGYLDQPHTSAGRVPSEKAYRLYVDELMLYTPLSGEEAGKIQQHVSRRIDEAEELVAQTARVISEITDYTSIITPPNMGFATIRHVQLIPVGDGRALVVIVTDEGVVRDAIVPIPEGLGADELERFSRTMTRTLANKSLSDAVEYLTHAEDGEMREYRRFYGEVADAVAREAQSEAQKIMLYGATNLLKHPEYSDVNKVRNMLAVLETKETLLRVLQKARMMEFTVTIGAENEIDELRDSSIVTATYKVGDQPVGSFGVIGPMRMNYSKVLAVLGFMGKSLSEMFSVMSDVDEKFDKGE